MFGAVLFFFQAEDGIRYLVRSRGLGDVYKRQHPVQVIAQQPRIEVHRRRHLVAAARPDRAWAAGGCLLYTSDAADERSSVDLGGRRIIKKKTITKFSRGRTHI